MADPDRYREHERRLFADAGIAPAERQVTLPRSGVTARLLVVGDGEPALFLHGGPNAAATWSYLAGATPGVRCLLLDRPGTGLSEPFPAAPDATNLGSVLEELVVEVLDALAIEQAHLVGSSLGGYAALRAAAARPDRVQRVVLLGCPAFVPGWTPPGFFRLLRTPVLGRILVAPPPTAGSVRMSLRQMGQQASLAAGAIPAPMLEWIRSWQRDTDTFRNDAEMIRRCGTWRDGFDDRLDLTDRALRAVKAPTLVVVGTDDPVGAEPVGRDLAARLPEGHVEVWPDAGHLIWLDDPVRAGALVSSFLTSES